MGFPSKYGKRFFASKEAIEEAGKIWGCIPNEHGVCRPLKRETIVQIGQCEGSFSFYETSKGYWLRGLSAMSGYSGTGYAPSIWDCIGYPTYDDARLSAVVKLIRFFERVLIDENSCNSKSNRKNAREVLKILETEKMPQLSLF